MLKSCVPALAFVLAAASAVKIPPQLNLKKCDFNAKECLRDAIEDALPKLKNGAPELGIPALEPVEITEIALEDDQNAPINLNLKLKNVKIWGVATGSKLKKLRWENDFVELNSWNDKIVMEGDYESVGKLLAFPIAGDGPFRIELTDVSARTRLDYKPVTRKGANYKEIVKLDYNVEKIGNTKIRFEGLVKGGNQALNDNLNRILNENWEELDRQMRPAFSKAFKLYFFGVSQRFFRRVPVNDIFSSVK